MSRDFRWAILGNIVQKCMCVCVHILYANIRAGIQRRLQTIDVLKLSVATECGNVYFKAHTGLHQQQVGGVGGGSVGSGEGGRQGGVCVP